MTVHKQTGMNAPLSLCSADDVVEYLRKHRDFFDDYQDLLVDLKLTHTCGDAQSLIERQVALLRKDNRRLASEINELIDVARKNDAVLTRIQQLVLTLIESSDINQCLIIFEDQLKGNFSADGLAIRLFPRVFKQQVSSAALLGDEAKAHEYFSRILTCGMPLCGQFNEQQVAYFFGARINQARSLVVVPFSLPHGEPIGLFALASHHMDHFRAGMSTSFLHYLGKSCAVILKRFL